MKRILFYAVLLVMLSSCTSEFDRLFNGSRPSTTGSTPVFFVTTEPSVLPETKTFADSQMRVLWNEGDQISIFNKITYNQGFEFDGDDGDTAGGFNPFTQMPMFGSWGDLDYIYAVYPYSTNNKCGYDGDLTVMLPAEQPYKESSFGIGANTMVAVTEESRLRFKNVGGYLSLRLYGDNVKVSSVTIQGNNGEKIAGKAKVTIPLDGTPTTVMDNSATDAITIICNPEVQLGADAEHYTDFWFVIPPVTFTNGFTITVIDDQGGVFEKTTTRSLTVVRNQLDWMDPLEAIIENTGSDIIIGDDLEQLYQVVNDFIQEINWASDHLYGMTLNDSIKLFEGLIEFARVREYCINYAFDPSLDSRDRRYFKYCTGYNNKPIIDSIKFTDITWNDFRSHGLDLTTTCLDNYDEGDVVRCSIFKSLSLQLFNSAIADLFYEEVDQGWRWVCVHELIDPESAINADNYNAFLGEYRYDASLEAIVPLDEIIRFEDAAVKSLCIANWDTNGDGELSLGEAAAVRTIGTVFQGKGIARFNELRYFSGISSIEEYAFDGCTSLASIVIPRSVTSIGDCAFNYCRNLTIIEVPLGVTAIGNGAFYCCQSLTGLTIPPGVLSIGASAFEGCGDLESITLPAGVTYIGEYAFYGCGNLTSLTFPSGITSIGDGTFVNCSSLTSFVIPPEVTSIGEYAFSGCNSLTSLLIPSGVTDIGDWAFAGCSSLTSLVVPSSVKHIGTSVFEGCSGLESIVIPSGATSIGEYAFCGCSSLTSLEIPSAVTSIGNRAFEECRSLTSFIVYAIAPPTAGSDIITATNCDIQVPASSVHAYRVAAGWSAYVDRIVAIGDDGGSGTVTTPTEEALHNMYQATEQLLQTIAICEDHWIATYNDSANLVNAINCFANARKSYLKYRFKPSSESRDRDYFKYCTGYDTKPIIDSVKFSDITFIDVRGPKFKLTTTRLDDYNEGSIISCNVYNSIFRQLLNSLVAVFLLKMYKMDVMS